MIGTTLSGRYLIEEVVGTGGMAVVYRALDTSENKTVAVKVLRKEYQSNDGFVRRFCREAEAAAKMSHENIVNLLDIGIDGDIRYIVMEYVRGKTLKEMIREEGRIHPDAALRMALRILAAVDHAHRNGIVHRDIKPQNILVNENGEIKVADFGIARLTAYETSDTDSQDVVGSVHYISPEQAKGEQANEQSDLYSVGVVLYEMLTGRVPFDGETAVSVALKHVREKPRSMRKYNPNISRAMDEVVMRALAKDREERYENAAEMAADLRRTVTEPKGGFVRSLPKTGKKQETGSKKGRTGKSAKRPGKTARVLLAVLAFCVLTVIAVYILFVAGIRRMPQLIGMSAGEAVEALEKLGVHVSEVNAYSDDYAEGIVMLQSEAAGDEIRKTDYITLTVSLGTQWYYLEDLSGRTEQEAEEILTEGGLTCVHVQYTDSLLPVGTVIQLDKQEGWVSKDTPLTVYVSGKLVPMPDLDGMTEDGARAVIEAAGLIAGEITEEESADAVGGTVVSQSIEAGTRVLTDTAVDLRIASQRNITTMPIAPLTVIVPLDGLEVNVDLISPSGIETQAYHAEPEAGTLRIPLTGTETGTYSVTVTMDGVVMQKCGLYFC